MDENWDYLIILDACRFDYFSKYYGNYLQGKLDKVYSVASCTPEWCKKSFKEYYGDVVYVSGNPYINSRTQVGGFLGKNHFSKIIDVWEWAWDDKIGTVRPENITEAAIDCRKKYSEKRLIIHYLQPHSPYLNYDFQAGFSKPNVETGKVLTDLQNIKTDNIVEKTVDYFSSWAYKWGFFNSNPSWKIRELLNLNPKTPMDAIRRKLGNSGLQHAYICNLKLVLFQVNKLVQNLSGKIIITADHGELLGEGNNYSHPYGSSNSLLREVPWFTITTRKENTKSMEKNMIIQKVKQLKSKVRL